MTTATTPTRLGPRARHLWRDVTAAFELSTGEVAILTEACRTIDLVDRLALQLADEPLTVTGSRDQQVLNPIAAEVRAQRELLSRLLSRLALPPEDDEQAAASVLGRRGAQARWYGAKRTRGS